MAVGLAAPGRPRRGGVRLLHRPAVPARRAGTPGAAPVRPSRRRRGARRRAPGGPRLPAAADRGLPDPAGPGGGRAGRRRPAAAGLHLRGRRACCAWTTTRCWPTRRCGRPTRPWSRWSTSTSGPTTTPRGPGRRPEVTVECFGVLATRGGRGPRGRPGRDRRGRRPRRRPDPRPARPGSGQRRPDQPGRRAAADGRRHRRLPLRGRRRMSPGGYFGRALVVDVTDGTSRVVELDDRTLREHIGGAGLGVRLLTDLAPAGVDPLGAGRATGLRLLAAGRARRSRPARSSPWWPSRP